MKSLKQKPVKLILFIILGLIGGYAVGFSLKVSERSEFITNILKEACDCKEVNQIIYAKGIQFGTDGLTTEKAEYELVECSFTSIEEEVEKINKLLMKKIKNFDRVDLLELEFVNNNKRQIFKIKNGIITH
jgi:hypothetical protein